MEEEDDNDNNDVVATTVNPLRISGTLNVEESVAVGTGVVGIDAVETDVDEACVVGAGCRADKGQGTPGLHASSLQQPLKPFAQL